MRMCRELLEAPLADAAELTAGRLPVPRLVQTEHNGSQVHLISRCSPDQLAHHPTEDV